jgi:CheY-like chemotaxis protein
VSTTVSATVGVTTLALGGFAPWNEYLPIWLTWWLGDVAGALLVTPLLLTWKQRAVSLKSARQWGEALLLVGGLPGYDGYEVARHVRGTDGGDAVYLIALTGYGQPQDRQRAEDAGFDLHIVKPVDIDHLTALIANAGRNVR